MAKTVIFTDLDGTLLHPKTYSFGEALPALDAIREQGIPLILCSSKTRAEMEAYRRLLRNSDPFVVENGGAIYSPKGYFPFQANDTRDPDYVISEFGTPYAEIRSAFLSLRDRLGASVRGFGDMTVGEIVRITGLAAEEAARAQQREYGEPFVFEQGADERFLRAIEEQGLRWTRGACYFLMGNHDKGKAIRMLKQWYEKAYGKLSTIGLGDGFNDLPMLREADQAVLIPKEDGSYDARVEFAGLRKAKDAGPAGWNQAVLDLLKR